MKKIILIIGIIVMLVATRVAFGQQEGAIQYEVKVNLHRTLPAERQDAKAMMPEFRTTKQVLFFNATESLYKPIIEDEDDEEVETRGNGGMRFRRFQPNVETYSNVETGLSLSKQEFMGKNYLIQDTIKMSPWKMGTEIKVIQGFECKQAYYTDEQRKQTFTAWFTDKLRPELGPDRFQTLPGAVLAIDVNDGERTTVATKIDLRELKKNELKAPASGTPITRQEFRKMVDEQMKKRGEQGGVIIRN